MVAALSDAAPDLRAAAAYVLGTAASNNPAFQETLLAVHPDVFSHLLKVGRDCVLASSLWMFQVPLGMRQHILADYTLSLPMLCHCAACPCISGATDGYASAHLGPALGRTHQVAPNKHPAAITPSHLSNLFQFLEARVTTMH